MCKLSETPAVGSGVAAVRKMHIDVLSDSGMASSKIITGPEDFHSSKHRSDSNYVIRSSRTENQVATRHSLQTPRPPRAAHARFPDEAHQHRPSDQDDSQYIVETLVLPVDDEVCNSRRSSELSISGTVSNTAAAQEDRVRVECDVCGYTCELHWFSDEGRCLKCQSSLKRRSSVQDRRGAAASPARLLRVSATSTTPGTPTPRRPQSASFSSYGTDIAEVFLRAKGKTSSNDIDRCTEATDCTQLGLLSDLFSERQGNSRGDLRPKIYMKCTDCSHYSIPTWKKNESHCSNCKAVLRRRPGASRRRSLTSGTRETCSASNSCRLKIAPRRISAP